MKKVSDEEFIKTVKESVSWAEVSRKLNVHHTGSRLKRYKEVCEKLKIDYSHILSLRWPNGKQEKIWGNKIPLSEILIENSTYKGGTNHIKTRLLKEKILENKCCACNNDGEWEGKILILQMDHINGINTDNRIENLRILCPNCHTQTKTYGAKKR